MITGSVELTYLLYITKGLQKVQFPQIAIMNDLRVNLPVIAPLVLNCLAYPLLSRSQMHPLTVLPPNPFHLSLCLCLDSILFFSWGLDLLISTALTVPLFLAVRQQESSLVIVLPLHVLSEVPEKIWQFVLAVVHLLCSDLAESSCRISSL